MPTHTNLVILQGRLEIETASVTLINRVQIPVLNGWIYTTYQTGLEDCFDERHPMLILRNPPLLSSNCSYIYNFNNRTSLLVLLLF